MLSQHPQVAQAHQGSVQQMERNYYHDQAPPAQQLGALRMEPVMENTPVQTTGTPPREYSTVTPTGTPTRGENDEFHDQGLPEEQGNPGGVDGDEALLDLAQLEELHQEAERMKALGNKHMAAQEYTRAYNAYSAALQLSPVGPSSHVFLSNRSAALLSLKRYSAAATDARRAIALAPTFGKAHARLGQSLYFLKDYEGAVIAYEDAIHYEPDNAVTRTYLEKAKTKLQRQKEKAARASRGEEVSVLTSESSMQATVVNSVATDTHGAAAVVSTLGFRGHSNAMSKAVGGALATGGSPYHMGDTSVTQEDEDPDFDEAIRIQERANKYLANKNYKYAIEEYTAALFLVPDDLNLSPDLHLGRAHALNGSRRHESAKIDAQLAIKIKPTPEAFSTLAKSLFYMKDFQGSVDAFGSCKKMLPPGESLSMFDRAYLQKAEKALVDSMSDGMSQSVCTASSKPIPKLKPPRFVPREEALNRTPNMPAMPKQWPQQSPAASNTLQLGPERNVVFLSEALGIKLNRGPDGVVRVLAVSPELPGSPIARKGKIEVGDIVREAGGVDIRRPITNIMWGDTVALIKMAPRPIVLVVAKELSVTPPSIMNSRRAAAAKSLTPTAAATMLGGENKLDYGFFPSNSNGEEGVRNSMESEVLEIDESHQTVVEEAKEEENVDSAGAEAEAADSVHAEAEVQEETLSEDRSSLDGAVDVPEESVVSPEDTAALPVATHVEEDKIDVDVDCLEKEEIVDGASESAVAVSREDEPASVSKDLSLRDQEAEIVGGQILFERTSKPGYNGWDNLRWMSYSGVRKVRFCELMSRLVPGRKGLFWSGDQYVTRKVAIYDEPRLILVFRPPKNVVEIVDLLDWPPGSKLEDAENAFKNFLIVESVVDPKTCKLSMSPLTTVTSVLEDVPPDDHRRRSCFELITPTERNTLSAVRLRAGAERVLTSFSDSGAFLETSCAEVALKKTLCDSHTQSDDVGSNLDLSWKHQIILGTLHSYTVSGNQMHLDKAIKAALKASEDSKVEVGSDAGGFLDPRIVDAADENGRSPLYYACSRRSSAAVESLVKAGADLSLRTDPHGMTPCHICAETLDHKSLAVILTASRRPNTLDERGRTAMYVAIVEGRTVGGMRNFQALDRCLSVLDSHGGQIVGSKVNRHPVSIVATKWQSEELSVVLKYEYTRYPLPIENVGDRMRLGISLSASFQYPVHSALITLRKKIKAACEGGNVQHDAGEYIESAGDLVSTLQVLFSFGFEPNERIEGFVDAFDGADELAIHIGYAPIQILAAAALDASVQKDILGAEVFIKTMNLITATAEIMVKNGARVTLDHPPKERTPLRKTSYITHVESSGETELTGGAVYAVDRSLLKIQSNKELEALIGMDRLNAAHAVWRAVMSVKSSGKVFLFKDNKSSIEDSEAPGGSDEKTCAICWKVFGKLMNRRHRCRITTRHVCDECSSKRMVEDGEENRISDGQYLLAKVDEAKQESQRLEAEKELERRRRSEAQLPSGTAAARLERLEAEERAQRDNLFGGVMENMARAVFGDESETPSEAHERELGGMSAQLNQTRDALNERGDKLNTLAEKSDKLVNASRDFASMAKELNQASRNQGLFW